MIKNYTVFPFVKNGKFLNFEDNNAICGLTVRNCGSMRFRWNEENLLRKEKLAEISKKFNNKTFVPVELQHTHTVYDVKNQNDTKNKIGDGIITKNADLIPTVTVADCMPLYFFDSNTGVFGIVHSGWKGTGIIFDALMLAAKNYGSKPQNFCVTIGPHIRNCCYIVDSDRAKYFSDNFGNDCVKLLEDDIKINWTFKKSCTDKRLFRLSLEKANLAVLEKAGVLQENIYIHNDCTCCSKNELYGSNRRETMQNGCPNKFTVQAAFVVKK